MDQQLLQIQLDQLLSPKRFRLSPHQLFLVRIIHRAGKHLSGLHQDLSQKTPFSFSHLQDFILKKPHGRIAALKGDHNQIGGADSVCRYIMELVGFMENNVSPVQGNLFQICRYLYLPFIHTKKLPEIVGLSRKFKITHIFKIMNTDDPIDGKFFL